MYTVSFAKEALNINIHNQYQGLELTSPVYFSNGTTCRVSPSQQTDTGTIMQASFGIAFKQETFEGALLYKLQRKHSNRSDDQPDNSTAPVEDTETGIYLLVLWNVESDYHRFRVCLITCVDEFTWDEDKLWALYKEYSDQVYESYRSSIVTWLMHSNAVMETRFDVKYGSGYKLNIGLSERSERHDMREPVKIDPKR
jgi:hypothetical protein